MNKFFRFRNTNNYVNLTESSSYLDQDSPGPPNRYDFFKLFRYTTWFDWILVIIGSIASIINGALIPICLPFASESIDRYWNSDGFFEVIRSEPFLKKVAMVGSLISLLNLVCWMVFGERQRVQVQKRYMKTLLSQDISFLESIDLENEMKEAQKGFDEIQNDVGERIEIFLFHASMCTTAIVISIMQGWQLALVLAGFCCCFLWSFKRFDNFQKERNGVRETVYRQAGGIAKETLNNMKAVFMLGDQKKKKRRYEAALEDNASTLVKLSKKVNVVSSLIFVSSCLMMTLSFLLGFVFVNRKVTNHFSNGPYTENNVMNVFFGIGMIGYSFLRISFVEFCFREGKSSKDKVFKLLERKDHRRIGFRGIIFPQIEGKIEFRHVSVTESEKHILDDVNFKIKAKEKIAFVGEPDSGRATCLYLIERFCDLEDQEHGSILIDGHEIKDIDLKCLRENISFLGKDSGLFETKTIKENLLMGKENATSEEIWTALEGACVAEFIDALPLKMNTLIGGSTLTKGQKHALAIARIILKNPKILLIDEVMIASFNEQDNEVEMIRRALDAACKGRTTVIIACTLESMVKADRVIMFEKGRVIEEGKHQELVEKQGKYYTLQLKAEILKNEVLVENIVKSNESESKGALGDLGRKLSKHMTGEETRSLSEDCFCGYIMAGIVLTSTSFLFARWLGFALVDYENENLLKKTSYICFLLFIFILSSGLLKSILFSKISLMTENTNRAFQVRLFEKYLKMPPSWFKHPENNPEALESKLSDAPSITPFLSLDESSTPWNWSFVTFIICLFIGNTWRDIKFILLCLGFTVVLEALKYCAWFVWVVMRKFDKKTDVLAHEITSNIWSVLSLGIQEKFEAIYYKKLKGRLMKRVVGGILSIVLIWMIWSSFIHDDPDQEKDTYRDYYHNENTIENKLQSLFCIVFFFYYAIIGDFLSSVSENFGINLDYRAKLSNILKIFDTKSSIDADESSQESKPEIKGKIEFVNVSFKYPDSEKLTLENFSFELNLPSKIAFISSREKEKIAILELLQRYYDPDSGDILVDGVNIKLIDVKYLRSCFGTDDPVLFDGSIKDNIKIGKENATEEEIKDVAEKAGVLNLIENNDEILVDSKRNQLSKIEKQRVAIARMILKDPPILIMEDNQDEELLGDSLKDLMEGRKALIVVSNKIAAVKKCDEILVFDEGKLIEKGSYDVLKGQQGFLYKLEKASFLT